MPGQRSDHRIRAIVLMGMRLVVVGWLVTGLLRAQYGAGHHWPSTWFWTGLALLIVATAALACREREHLAREFALESAVAEQTADLARERRREQDRSRILEMLVANAPLMEVLNAILRHIEAQCGDIACIIAVRQGDGCQTLASINAPAEWLLALRSPGGVPFEAWRNPVMCVNLPESPAWRLLVCRLQAKIPASAICRPIRCKHGQATTLFLLYPSGKSPGARDVRVADVAERLARLAIEHSRLYESLDYQANHDSLTGLPNRVFFNDSLDRSICEAQKLNLRIAVLFIDLDHFKKVNDIFSHSVGDLLLVEIANRMQRAVRPGDMVARFGGDEFTILLGAVSEARVANEIADRVLETIRQPVTVEGYEITTSASVGIAIFPDDGNDAAKLQRAADAAMYSAKDTGRDRAETFSAHTALLDNARLDEVLRMALNKGYLVLHYQPKVSAAGSPAGFEALVRVDHPLLGLLAPANFIPEAEASGLIVPIGNWVLDEVCRQIAEWRARGLDAISVAINVSSVQICRGDFARLVAACLRRYDVDASRLEVELTESLMIGAGGVAQEQLRALRALGVRLSIDDFGTGYSSLSYLHKMPIDAIKLDKSFVQSIDSDHLAHRLVHAMIGVAEGLGLKVVAEGVETEEQRRALIEAGCEVMQGFLFSKPHPAREIEDFLRPLSFDSAAQMTRDLIELAT